MRTATQTVMMQYLRCSSLAIFHTKVENFKSVVLFIDDDRFQIIRPFTSLTWSGARDECESRNMTLPSTVGVNRIKRSDVIGMVQRDNGTLNRVLNTYIWLDGKCGWNLNQPGELFDII